MYFLCRLIPPRPSFAKDMTPPEAKAMHAWFDDVNPRQQVVVEWITIGRVHPDSDSDIRTKPRVQAELPSSRAGWSALTATDDD